MIGVAGSFHCIGVAVKLSDVQRSRVAKRSILRHCERRRERTEVATEEAADLRVPHAEYGLALEDGSLVIVVPNGRHPSIRLELLVWLR